MRTIAENENLCVLLIEMSRHGLGHPSDYLWNDLQCAHARFITDVTVFTKWYEWHLRNEQERNRKMKSQGNLNA